MLSILRNVETNGVLLGIYIPNEVETNVFVKRIGKVSLLLDFSWEFVDFVLWRIKTKILKKKNYSTQGRNETNVLRAIFKHYLVILVIDVYYSTPVEA